MSIHRCVLLALAGCSSLPVGAARADAATYYVAVTGADAAAGTSPGTAWKTVTHAAARAMAGDTVYIKAGLYRGEKMVVRNSGAEGSPVVFQGYKDRPGETVNRAYVPGEKLNPDELPVLEGDGAGSGIGSAGRPLRYVEVRGIGVTRYNYGVEIERAQCVTLNNVFAVDTGEVGIFVYDSTDCRLVECTSTDAGVDNIWLLRTHTTVLEGCTTYGTVFEGQASTDYYIILTDSRDNVVRGCLAHNLHAQRYAEHGQKGHPGHGIGIKDRAGPKGYGQPHSTGNRIVDCVARNMGEHFYVAHEAYDNEFVGCTATSEWRLRSHWSEGINIRDGAHDNTFRDCRVEGARTSVGIQETVEGPNNADGSPLDQVCSRNTVTNCTLVDSNIGIEIGNADDNLVRNCVFDGVGEWALVRFISADRSRRLDHKNLGNTCRNTIVTGVRGSLRLADAGVGDQLVYTHSAFWKNSFAMPEGVGNVSVDPRFVDAAKRDYRLRSNAGRWERSVAQWVRDPETSPCFDAGDPADDFSAEPEPNGARIDIGAYGGTAEAWRKAPVAATRPNARRTAAQPVAAAPPQKDSDTELAAALAAGLRAFVIAGVAAGKHETVYLDISGGTVQTKVIGADEAGLAVTVGGMETRVLWTSLAPLRFFGIARKYCSDREVLEAFRVSAGIADDRGL